MELRVLRYFLAVAREENITRAANALHLTQPTLSRQLRDLEEELGKQLFIRKSHHIELTPEGMFLRKRAEEIVAMVDKTEADFFAMESIVAGDVSIGGGETQALCDIAALINDLRQIYPDVHYHLYSGNAEDVIERLDKGLLDFGIVIQPTNIAKYDTINLPGRDVWGVVMRKDSPLAAKTAIAPNDLLGLPLILSRQAIHAQHGSNAFIDWFGALYEQLNIVATFNLVYNAALLVEAGVGYTITLDKLANTAADSPLTFRPLTPRLESGLAVIWKKYQIFSPAAQCFLNALLDRFENT